MTFLFTEINDKILKFDKEEERRDILEFYIKTSIEKLNDEAFFDHNKLMLLLNILQYAEDDETRRKLVFAGLNKKIASARLLVLDLIDIDFSREQKVFYRPDKWIGIILKDIKETFDYEDLLKDTNYKEKQGIDKLKLTEEELKKEKYKEEDFKRVNYGEIDVKSLNLEAKQFKDVYKTEDVFLCLTVYNRRLCNEIVDIFCSCDKFNSSGNQLILNIITYIDKMSFIDYNYMKLIKKIKSNFMEGKDVPIEDILQGYKTYKKDKREKRESANKTK